MSDIAERFVTGLQQTGFLEFTAVIAGILSVWFSRKENILVYPTGLINTLIYIYLSLEGHLLGEASVNVYYSVMNIYGWVLWSKKDEQHNALLVIQHSSGKGWLRQILFFVICYLVIFFLLSYFRSAGLAPEALPGADALASASAYTAMWLMARKKVESWYWWIVTNLASVPLYFIKGYVFTSFQFIVLLALAIAGLITWHKKAKYAGN